jgi:hypothetical protein
MKCGSLEYSQISKGIKIAENEFDSRERLTKNEQRALLSGLTAADIEAARDLAKSLAWTARAGRPTFRR